MFCDFCFLENSSFQCQSCMDKKISEFQSKIQFLEREIYSKKEGLKSKIFKFPSKAVDLKEISILKSQIQKLKLKFPSKRICKKIILESQEPIEIQLLQKETDIIKGKLSKAQNILKRELLSIFNIKIQIFSNSSCKLLINNLYFNPYDTSMPIELYNHNFTCIIHLVILLSWYLEEFLPINLDFSNVLDMLQSRDDKFIQVLASLNYNLLILCKRCVDKKQMIDTNYLMCLLIQEQPLEDFKNCIEYSEVLRLLDLCIITLQSIL